MEPFVILATVAAVGAATATYFIGRIDGGKVRDNLENMNILNAEIRFYTEGFAKASLLWRNKLDDREFIEKQLEALTVKEGQAKAAEYGEVITNQLEAEKNTGSADLVADALNPGHRAAKQFLKGDTTGRTGYPSDVMERFPKEGSVPTPPMMGPKSPKVTADTKIVDLTDPTTKVDLAIDAKVKGLPTPDTEKAVKAPFRDIKRVSKVHKLSSKNEAALKQVLEEITKDKGKKKKSKKSKK